MDDTLGKRIQRLMEERKVTKTKLAEVIDRDRASVYAYLKDANSMSVEVLIKLARFFKISLDELVGNKLYVEDTPHDITEPAMEYVSMVEMRLSKLEEEVVALQAQIKSMKKDHARKEVVKV